MNILFFAFLLGVCVIGGEAQRLSNIENEQAEHWKTVAKLYNGGHFKIYGSNCDAKDTNGNKTCVSCLTCEKDRGDSQKTVCLSTTPRLDFRELYVELFINGTWNTQVSKTEGRFMMMQEIIKLDDYNPKPARKEMINTGFDDPGIRAFPINVIQRLNGRGSMKFCVEAVTGGKSNGGFGGRWCFKYNGEVMKGTNQFLMLGTEHDPARYTPVEWSTRDNPRGEWLPLAFNEITP